MKEKRELRTAKLQQVRLTPSEKKAFEEEFLASFIPYRSELIRYKLLDKAHCPVKEKAFEKVIVAGEFLEELSQMGDRINQIAKRMNTYKDGKIMKQELLTFIDMIKLVGNIKEVLTKK